MEDEILGDFVGLGHKTADILKEIDRLEKSGIIYITGSIYYLTTDDFS